MLQVHRVSLVSILFGLTVLVSAPVAQATSASKWYLQGKLGDVDLDARFGITAQRGFADSAGAASVEVGYIVGRYLALQAGYHDLGEFTGAGSGCPERSLCITAVVPLRAELTGVSLSAVPRVPFNERWSAFGRFGLIDWESDIVLDGLFGNQRIDTYDGNDLLTGLGVQYEFPSGLGLLVERQRFDLTGGWTTLGASWRF